VEKKANRTLFQVRWHAGASALVHSKFCHGSKNRESNIMRLKNESAVITAAASVMARAGVEQFAREGARVAAIDIDSEALAKLATDMAAKGPPIDTIQADLSSADEARGSIHTAADKLGGIDILWAHAGVPGPEGVEDLDLAAYRKAMAINVDAPVLAASEVIGHMRSRITAHCGPSASTTQVLRSAHGC
jgi:NAD(P)-dependent dehydrogenase (short-subunit alcohol dehydrogenase family)